MIDSDYNHWDWLFSFINWDLFYSPDFPQSEVKDGRDIDESRRRARELDEQIKLNPTKELPARVGKSLDKEFWETM